MTHTYQQHSGILCFRAFDMRDRFPEPVETFAGALALLQSERAYMPEMIGSIVCYLKSGESITIPSSFYLEQKKNFSSLEEATQWVTERAKDPTPHLGFAIANPDLPIDQQIQEAMLSTETFIIPSSENPSVCVAVNEWLNKYIDALLNEKVTKDKSEKTERLLEAQSMKDYRMPQSPKETEASDTKYAETIAFFKARFDDLKNPKRWVITSRDCGLTDITGNAYFDVVNHLWVSRISDATCIKDKTIADSIISSFGEDSYASVIEHYVSQKELAKSAIKLENDPAVIYYHSLTDTYLYEECNRFSGHETHALIALTNPDQYTLLKQSPGPQKLFVSIPDIAMDALAIAWCKHRKIKCAFD